MMLRLVTLAALALVLVACAPALAPRHERVDGSVIVTVAANQPVYQVSLTVLDGATDDERCIAMETDAWCLLGDMAQGQVETVVVTPHNGPVYCTSAGYLEADRSVASYRAFACRVVGR
jgi:hypothetical protein